MQDFPQQIYLYTTQILAVDLLATLSEIEGVLGLVKLFTDRTDYRPKSGYWGICTKSSDWHHALECREKGIGVEKIWGFPMVLIDDDRLVIFTSMSNFNGLIIKLVKAITDKYEITKICDEDGLDISLHNLDRFYKLFNEGKDADKVLDKIELLNLKLKDAEFKKEGPFYYFSELSKICGKLDYILIDRKELQDIFLISAYYQKGLWDVITEVAEELTVPRERALKVIQSEIDFIAATERINLICFDNLEDKAAYKVLDKRELLNLKLEDVEFGEEGPFYYFSELSYNLKSKGKLQDVLFSSASLDEGLWDVITRVAQELNVSREKAFELIQSEIDLITASEHINLTYSE